MMSGNNENPADKAKTDELYENREPKKIIRIITVTAYMISVSFVGIVLSAYYIFLWHPPNPRLMHAMAHEGHHERLVSGPELMSQEAPVPIVSNFDRMAQSRFSGPVDDREIDVLADHFGDEAETVKRRREIVNNVNSFLSANFEKSQLRGIVGEETTISSLTQDTTEQVESTSTVSGQSPETSQETTTSMSPPQLFPSTKRIRNSAKKQQQMPFALKHLEVPIQSDRLKKRSARISSPSDSLTIGNAYIPSDSKGEAESGFPTLEPPSTAAAPRRSTIMQLPRKMSAHTVMASISRTLERARHSESRVPANEVKLAGEESKDRLYEPKHKQKLFRVLTVVAYIISVSLAAIVLSLYYMYIWDPSDHPHYILIAKRMGNSSFASNSSALGGAAAGVKICSNDGVGVQQGAGSDQVEPAVDAVRYDAALDKSKLPIESSDNTPAYVAAVIGERPSEPRLLGVMGLLKKLSSNNQPETPPASKNQQKDQYRLSKDTSESPILNRLPDYEEELAGTSELPDLVED